MQSSTINKALEIIGATNDGNDLSPPHLKLVELAVNNRLNDPGKLAFEELYQNVTKAGGYTVPWFHDIEHLTRDHEGYVRWKGGQVEHYDSRWCYSEEALKSAQEVARRCRLLEYMGEVPSTANVIWHWPIEGSTRSELRDAFPAHALDKLLEGYRNADPQLLAMLQEFDLIVTHLENEHMTAAWEDEGGK